MLHKLIATLRKRGAHGRTFPVQASEAAQAAELIAGVVAQRDELLEALNGIISATTDGTCTTPLLNAFETARVTLAKYKREHP